MSDFGSRGENVPPQFGPRASRPILSDVEALVLVSAVLGLALALLT